MDEMKMPSRLTPLTPPAICNTFYSSFNPRVPQENTGNCEFDSIFPSGEAAKERLQEAGVELTSDGETGRAGGVPSDRDGYRVLRRSSIAFRERDVRRLHGSLQK